MVFTPEEAIWASLWLAAAAAVVVIKDFVISTNLRSADACANRSVKELSDWIGACRWEVNTGTCVNIEVFVAFAWRSES